MWWQRVQQVQPVRPVRPAQMRLLVWRRADYWHLRRQSLPVIDCWVQPIYRHDAVAVAAVGHPLPLALEHRQTLAL
jgi:hypothetical protein